MSTRNTAVTDVVGVADEPSQPRFWRTLEELESTAEFQAALAKEFPAGAPYWLDETTRRSFLTRMGASLALAGLVGCGSQPSERIVPTVEEPEGRVPGKALFFATAMPTSGGAIGVLVKSHDGRPTKIEGNPQHPASLGSTDTFAQASILDLYDPDRSEVVRHHGQISGWSTFTAALKPRIDSHRARKGAGLHLLTEPTTSPTLLDQISRLLKDQPQSQWHEFESLPTTNIRAGQQQAFGRALSASIHLAEADVILSIDSDFLGEGPARVRLAREFSDRRRQGAAPSAMSRLYVAECGMTITGAAADHRLGVAPAAARGLLVEIARQLGIDADGTNTTTDGVDRKWIETAAADLKAAGSKGVVLLGPAFDVKTQALALAINSTLGNIGTAIRFTEPIDRPAGVTPSPFADLVGALYANKVETLIILGCNPVFAAPFDLGMAAAIEKAEVSVHHGHSFDETANRCTWHIPAAHHLESWSDVRSDDGAVSLIQPLIEPLYSGRTSHEMLNVLLGAEGQPGFETVRAYWKSQLPAEDYERQWKRSLHDGVIAEMEPAPKDVSLRTELTAELAAPPPTKSAGPTSDQAYDIVFRAHPSVYDGRYANNGWLQELPQPFSTLTWANAALIAPASARALNISTGDVLELTAGEQKLDVPAYVLPGQPQKVITLHVGQGRKDVGRNGTGIGTDVTPLRAAADPWGTKALVKATGRTATLNVTQTHHLMEGRDLVRMGTLAQYQESPAHPVFMTPGPGSSDDKSTFYPDWKHDSPQWGMTVDLGACIGCRACVVACQSENNIPIVGPEMVGRSREMHWLRIDTYFTGEADDPGVAYQPLMCQHCEHAPCEPVCPVGATTHSEEGLNEMTYNRCIGTRYCSNNCPYKVRRFNFLEYHSDLKELPVLQLQQNPDVTVRSRGVMEKCTYCVQRINAVRIQSEIDGREIRDGEIVTACQSVCPVKAFTFGDISKKDSAVSQQKALPLNYGILTELNTRPRTTYLAAVRNPNPALPSPLPEPAGHAEGGHG